MRIVAADLDDPRLAALLETHVALALANSGGPESCHALDQEGLKAPGVRVWAAWEGDRLAGVGALKRLSAAHGEIKSMHTAEAFRGRGVGSALLAHLIAVARADGMTRLSLETGVHDYFRPAVRLYLRHGFVACPPFVGYREDPNSLFLTLDLA